MKSEYTWRNFYSLLLSAHPSRLKLIFGIVFNGISAVLASILPIFIQKVIDSFSQQGQQVVIGNYYLIVFVIFFIQAVAQVIGNYSLNVVGVDVVTNLRIRLWNKVVKLPKVFFDRNNSGELSSRIVNDTSMIYDLVSREVAQFFNAIIYISIGVIVLFILDWKLLIVVLFGIPLFFILFIPVGRILSKISKNIQDSIANLNERAFQMTSENTLTKISSAENFEIGIGKKKIATLKQHLVKQIKILAFLTPVVNLIVMGIVISIITYGGIRVADGTLSVGTLIGFMIVVVMIINPISNLSSFFSELQRTKGATERISEILNERVEKLELGQNIDIRGKSLRLREVEFRYQNQDDGFKLNNINMSIEVGSKHALVGPSGGGKSTILALIERLYDLDSGEILLGNLNVNEISLKSWRSQIGYVSQENDLISGTIKENLLYGLIEENVDDTDIIFACKAAFAWEFIEEMSDKLDTMIGERGVTLSGGQRQRLSIARTFLRNPNILLLDEATANLDSNSEKQIQDAIDNIMKGRTVIAIAHRLSTIINSDQIYFVQEGTITGYGTHEELLGSHHLYKEFYKQQMESGL